MKEPNKIKMDTKKVMAYPKSNSQDDYELFSCLHCGEEYLSQGLIFSEQDFCPRHSDFKVCVWCDSTNKLTEMVKENDEFYCKNCHSDRCIQCDKTLSDDENQFCSKQCYNEYWGEMTEE